MPHKLGRQTFTRETDNTDNTIQEVWFRCPGDSTYRACGQSHVRQKLPAAEILTVVLTPYRSERPRTWHGWEVVGPPEATLVSELPAELRRGRKLSWGYGSAQIMPSCSLYVCLCLSFSDAHPSCSNSGVTQTGVREDWGRELVVIPGLELLSDELANRCLIPEPPSLLFKSSLEYSDSPQSAS